MLKPEEINVHIDIFEGPMDLLLYLIRKNNLDIYDIPIAQITSEYLSYLDVMKELNLEVAGEFLVMASTLMQIKARTLLPSHQLEGEEQGPDPAAELVSKIAEYQKFKEASKFLEGCFEKHKDLFYRGTPMFADSEKVLNLELFELLEAVKRAFDKVDKDGKIIHGEEFPIEKKMEKILGMIAVREWILLDDVFAGETKKLGIITCFMAMLELIKLKKLLAKQDDNFKEIRIYLRPSEPQAAAPEGGLFPGVEDGAGRTDQGT